jgi:DNA repair ATPase RecN
MAQHTIFTHLAFLREQFGSDSVWRNFVSSRSSKYIDCLEREKTSPQIAEEWNLSIERIRQIKVKAGRELKGVVEISHSIKSLIISEDLQDIQNHISKKQKQAEEIEQLRLERTAQLNAQRMQVAAEVEREGMIG